MGLRQRLAGLALRRVHVLLVEVPGCWSTRATAQRELSARGWPEAASPADADVLLVCGPPGDALAAAVARVWDQLPGPRAQERAATPGDVAEALDRAVAVLADGAWQREDARERDRPPATDTPDQGDHGDTDHGDTDHGDTDHGDTDHGDMDMAPAGIPLAGGGEDRDGLEMDVLEVPLGPVLPCWPAGLVLWCSLQGDVVVSAEVEVLPAGWPAADPDRSPQALAAGLCDVAAQVLGLAGWDAAAQEATRVRDDLLTGADQARCLTRLDRLVVRVERSRLLRWSLEGLGRAPSDVHDRLLVSLHAAADLLRAPPGTAPAGQSGWVGTDPADLPRLVQGLDLAAARLVVAAAAPWTTPAGVPAEAGGDRG